MNLNKWMNPQVKVARNEYKIQGSHESTRSSGKEKAKENVEKNRILAISFVLNHVQTTQSSL